MDNKCMYIPNDDALNYLHIEIKSKFETFGHSTEISNQSEFSEVLEVYKPTNEKMLL